MMKTKRSPRRFSMNMKNCKNILLAAAFLAAAYSCTDKVRIDGTVEGLPDSKVVIKQLAGNTFNVLDTVKTDSKGSYSYTMEVKEGQPEFVYVFDGDTKLASLLLGKGDKVKVVSDAKGGYTVEGSDDCSRLKQVEDEFSSFLNEISSAVQSGDNVAVSRKYVEYYRSRVKYVLDNSKSLTVIPVLYQKINEDFPVFAQPTDAVLFRGIHDSLMTVYPDSKYVTALGKEAERRMNVLSFEQQIQNAKEAGFPDLTLPGLDGKNIKLSDISSKIVMVYFWQASEAAQKMFNQDVLLPLYKTYHPKGFEIYSVSLDADKGVWASAVRNQELPWVNVCDGRGAATPAVALYNLTNGLPVAYMILDGHLKPETLTSEKEIKAFLAANLK